MRNFSPRKLICLMIPIFGTVSIIGTGFSLWTFSPKGEHKETEKLGINLNVTAHAENGCFDNRSLITDDAAIKTALGGYVFPKMLIFDEGRKSGNPYTQGITFYKMVSNKENDALYDPNYITFENEPYISDNVLITYYRDASISAEDLNAAGLSVELKLKITITEKLSNFISILDTYDFNDLTSTLTTGPKIYEYDYTKFSKLYGVRTGAEIKADINTSIKTNNLTTPNDFLLDDVNYEEYGYIMNFSQIFRWKDLKLKPTDKKTYDAIKKLCAPRPGDTDYIPQSISFDFSGGYKDLDLNTMEYKI